MKRRISVTIGGLLWLALAACGWATSLTIESQPLNIEQGGEFVADLNGNWADPFDVFCVDYRNYVSIPDTYFVNISTPSMSLADTRYGDTADFSWNSISGSYVSASGDEFGDAYDRYVMAGWLTTQYNSDTTGSQDIGIQNAIWTLLDVNGAKFTSGSVEYWLQQAVDFMNDEPAEFTELASEIRIYTSTDVASDTLLNPNECNNRYSVGEQEMITVMTSPTPEPRVFALVGIGLVALGALRKGVFRRG